MPSLADLYRGASLSSRTTKSLGQLGGITTSGGYFRAKRLALTRDIAGGRKNISSLGASDLATLGLSGRSGANRSGGDGGLFKGVTGFFGNLGKDISDFATGLPSGAYQFGKSVVHDIASGPRFAAQPEKSEIFKNIIKPTAASYKQTYGQGNVLQNIYKHPLGPILDVASIASLGLGGAAKAGQVAARSGQTGRVADLAKLTSREGRPSISLPNGRPIERDYTPRPLAKAGQISLDKLGTSVTKVGEFQARRASARESRLLDQEFKGRLAADTAAVARPLTERFKQLDPDELLAFSLAIRGVNTPDRIAAFEGSVRDALGDADKMKKAEAIGVPREIIERRANLSDRVKRLVVDPTFEPESQAKMQAARHVWESDVQRGLGQLEEAETPITPEAHQAATSMYQRKLDNSEDIKPADFAPGQIEPTYAPDVQATNFEVHTPREKLSRLPFVQPGDPVVRPQKMRERTVDPGAITAENIFVPRAQRYLADATGETFLEGLFRSDPRVWVEHSIRRERDLHEKSFKRDLVLRNAVLDEKGEVRKFKNASEFRESGLSDTHVLVSPDFPIAWFRAETNFSKQAAGVIQRLKEAGDEVNEATVQKMLDELTDADAKAFLSSHWGAIRRPGVAVPKEFFEYQKKLAQVSDPFKNPVGRTYARFMHHWRNTVLAYMPRWGLNTAIGSFITNIVKGVVNPRDYVRGNQLGRMYQTEGGETLTQPSAVSRRLGADDLPFGSERLTKMEPPGVSLQGEAVQEMLEGSMAGYQNALGINFPTRKLVAGVQHIEDFFRRASFQHSLRKNAKEGSGPPEGVLEEMGDVLSDHFDEVISSKGDMSTMLKDERLVQRSLRDTNKFGYNYGALGPDERRYVRQFMPFYGWYKFISMLTARLPVEYPGRTAALNALANIGTDMQEDMGAMPEWIRGSIIIGINPDGTIKYLPTRGMNPFSSFFNPLAPGASIKQSTGMLGPLFQAGLQGIGFDTLTGDSVRISPESGVARDFLGALVNEQGEQVSPAQVQAVPRGLMGLARSVPGYRLGEKYFLEGGGSVYPEHIPFGIQPRPLSPASEDAITSGAEAYGLSALGVNPRGYDLEKYQRLVKKRAKYAKTRNRNSLRKTQRKFDEAAR